MSVSRPLAVSNKSFGPTFGGGPGGPRLSSSEQGQLEKENGGERFGLQRLGKPGEHFSDDRLVSTTQLSFPASEVRTVARLEGVKGAAGSLTLNNTHVSGTVPKLPAGGLRAAPSEAPGPPRSINFDSFAVTGTDETKPSLAPVTPGQVTSGRYLSAPTRSGRCRSRSGRASRAPRSSRPRTWPTALEARSSMRRTCRASSAAHSRSWGSLPPS